jgi:hypothetical protein
MQEGNSVTEHKMITEAKYYGYTGNAYALADAVRKDLDRQACPAAFMELAWESIVKNYSLTLVQPIQAPSIKEFK